MAYNTLSGTVEFAGANGSLENTVRTDNFNQSIDGKKTFLQRITCSAITLNGTVLSPTVVTSVTDAAATRVAFFDGVAGLAGHTGLIYTAAGGLTSSYFSGSGRGITHLRGDRFTTTISASNIKYGAGLDDSNGSNVLCVSGGAGISVTATGVKPKLDTYGGLNLNATTLIVDPAQAYDITQGGEQLATADKLLVQDVAGANPSAPTIRSMTVSYLTSYLNTNLTIPVKTYNNGVTHRVLTAGGASTIDGEPNLTFDGADLTVTGRIISQEYTGSGNLQTSKLTCSSDAYFSGAVGVGTANPAYDLHVNGHGATTAFVDGGASSDAFVRFGTAGTAKSYVKLGSGGNFIVAQDATGGDLELKAKPGGVSTTYFALDGGRTALTASVPLSCSLSVTASYYYGDGRHLTNVAGGGLISTYMNATDNYLLTSAGSGSINGESGLTFDGSTLVVQSTTSPIIQVDNTSNNAYGAVINLNNQRAGNAGVADDFCGGVAFLGKDSTSADTQYSKITTKISSPTNTSEAGRMIFEVTTGGTTASTYLTLDGARNAITSSVDTLVQAKLHQSGAVYKKYNEQSTNYTLTATDNVVFMNTTSGDLTASLPAAATVDGIIYMIKNTQNNNLVIDPDGSETIDGTAFISGPVGRAWTIIAFQGIWLVLGSHGS
tara:strand:- start:56286 stop:58271 length:1986 start_codon:yes stop_codon:yes gene_type:complete